MVEKIVFRMGTQVYLRPFDSSEAPILQRWINDSEVTKYLTRMHPVTLRQQNEWLEQHGKDDHNTILAIVTVDGDVLIGSIGLHKINYINRTAVTGAVIGEKEYWSKGYGTEAKMLLLDYAFNRLNLDRILSEVIVFNGRSLAYAHKCGYKEVGRVPGWIERDGARHDTVMLLVTRDAWIPLWEDYKKRNEK